MKTVVLFNKANEFGLLQDALLLQKTIDCILKDPLEPPAQCDVAIHLEVPYYGWMAFAGTNVFVINPEWWEESWNPYLRHADLLIFKCNSDKDRFLSTHEYSGNSMFLPWACLQFPYTPATRKDSVLWLLGGSVNKRKAAAKILPFWRAEWPTLDVYTTTPLLLEHSNNVNIHVENLTVSKRQSLQENSPCHLIFSAAEALGVSALEGEACGAFLLGNSLPTYVELFGGKSYAYLSRSTLEDYKAGVQDTFESFTQADLDACIDTYLTKQCDMAYLDASDMAIGRLTRFKTCVQEALVNVSVSGSMYYLPDDELPNISVVTLIYNRKAFLDLAFKNILGTDYPKDKIEWVIVDDSDDPAEQSSDKIIKFGRENGPLSLTYIPLAKRTIGRKRNVGVYRSQHDVVLFMDDDDYYPPSSFRRRVSSLLTHPWKPKAAACTTIACYDLVRGVSAVNTPPWTLGFSKRVSEATLVFYKNFWAEKNFPNINVSEGDGFLEGREQEVLELPPQQMIVAMSHGKNSSSRRFPEGSPSCFWGFSKEFLVFLHKLAGVEVE
jgi:hypothetical protein